MSKRLIRIPGTDSYNKLSRLQHNEIHVVLRNGVTHLGKLQSITPDTLTILDPRDHLHILSIDLVHEIILDTTAKLEEIVNK